MTLAGALFFAAWRRVMSGTGAALASIPLVNRIPMPEWLRAVLDKKVDEVLATGKE